MSERHAAPRPAYACLYAPPAPAGAERVSAAGLIEIAQAFSPRYECHGDAVVVIDVAGLERLMGMGSVRGGTGSDVGASTTAPERGWMTIGEELQRMAAAQHRRLHIAVAGTRVAALILAHARPGLTVAAPGQEAALLAPLPLAVFVRVAEWALPVMSPRAQPRGATADAVATFTRWSLRTLGELAALPSADLVARQGRQALLWQAVARGEDIRPLVPALPDERFDGSLDLEWPIENLEPLSFVLTRLLEPLSTRLERRDRGAAVLHVQLDLVTREAHTRQLALPSPIRDVRTLRTLALLDIESHPPAAAIDRVTIVIDPTPGRIVQHTLFTRALPTPERLSTLLARLGAVMGADRVGAPAVVDSYRPGAFAMQPFTTDPHRLTLPHGDVAAARDGVGGGGGGDWPAVDPPAPGRPRPDLVTALRRCRQPVPARVVLAAGRPIRITSDRRGFAGGTVASAVGPWRTSGHWWDEITGPARSTGAWDRDEWDVALSDRARYRVFRDRATDAWFIDGLFD